ncbi:MAG: DUF2975 domain-containing protein [Parcubacteria group bacterium]|nr:DUF2975 domain-containing protein [Parcubacteria group bacterium]
MKRGLLIFLKLVIILIGIVALLVMVRFPLTEGRAINLDLFSIYSDPFILYGYAASLPFFIVLYQASKLLGYIEQNKFSLGSVKALRAIKHSAIIQSLLIIMAVLYIMTSHNKDDDPAGFIVIGTLATFIFVVIATAASVFEKFSKSAVDTKPENDSTPKKLV